MQSLSLCMESDIEGKDKSYELIKRIKNISNNVKPLEISIAKLALFYFTL